MVIVRKNWPDQTSGVMGDVFDGMEGSGQDAHMLALGEPTGE